MLIAYFIIAVISGVTLAGFTLWSGGGLALALLAYCGGGTLGFVLSIWVAAAVNPGRWEPFAEDHGERSQSARSKSSAENYAG